jgi:peptidoglycan DL-endopeptidase CwlO
VHEQYQKNKARQEQLRKRIEPLQREVDLGRQRVGVMAAAVYKGGRADAFSAVVTSGSRQQLAEQFAFLDVLSREQDRQLEGVSKSKADLDGQEAPIDALVAELAKQDADLAQHRKAIEAKLTELQKLRTRAYGSGGGTGSYRPWPCPSEYLPTNGYKAASFACMQAGIPYVWAAAGPTGYDCSGPDSHPNLHSCRTRTAAVTLRWTVAACLSRTVPDEAGTWHSSRWQSGRRRAVGTSTPV